MQSNGGGTVAPPSGYQNSNAVIAILALPNSGFSFVSWTGSGSGSFSGTSPSATVTMDGPITETATFAPTSTVQITVESGPSNSGIVQVDGSSIITPQTYTWTPGTTHSLSAAFNPPCNYNCQATFQYWTSPSIGTVYSQTITYTVPSFSETVSALYQVPQNTVPITIAFISTGLNSIYVDGTQITTPQTFNWVTGSMHTLTANQYCGVSGCQAQFSYWQSSSIGTTNAASFTYTVPTYSETVTAYYTVAQTSNTFSFAFGSPGSGNGQFKNPHFITIDSSGNIYLTDSDNARVEKFDRSGNYITQWGSFGSGNGQFNEPTGIAVDSSGNVYVVDSNNHRVEKFTSSETYLSQFGSSGSGNGQFEDPTGIAVDSSGNVYVADNGANRVQEFTNSGTYLSQFGSPGSGNGQFSGVTGIAIEPSSGNIYVVDYGNNRVEEFTSSGTYVTQWGSVGSSNGQFTAPYGIAVDSSGRIYVTDSGNNRVEVFTTSGTYLSQFGLQGGGIGQFVNPRGVAVDSSGNVYVVDNVNNRVEVFQA
ncbi:MAG: 6-bladed beta-propeller [Candidatus Bathyarchaeia archaeon]